MKRKSLIALVLLFVMGFSMFHEYTFTLIEENHCTAIEYVNEIQRPINKGDICDIHYEYHVAYILPANNPVIESYTKSPQARTKNENYSFLIYSDFLKPPIS